MTYHHKHFPSLKRVAQYNAENHDSELDCADIVIHILDCMVDKYFNFVYGIEDKVYNFEAKHVDDRYSKSVMENVFQLRSDLIKNQTRIISDARSCRYNETRRKYN